MEAAVELQLQLTLAMTLEDMKRRFGDEYPAAAIVNGIRLPLTWESRFSRRYDSDEHKLCTEVSRFMDGSASITASELQSEWHTWSATQRRDFCSACSWLHQQSDFAEMLRFIMQHAASDEWSAVAMEVASQLPRDEAFDFLVRALRTVEVGETSNLTQGIALTKHADAESVLRDHLRTVWAHDALWADDEFLNWVAFDAMTCIAHLIELGAAPTDFEAQVRELSRHACVGNRSVCRGHLGKHYPWLAGSGHVSKDTA